MAKTTPRPRRAKTEYAPADIPDEKNESAAMPISELLQTLEAMSSQDLNALIEQATTIRAARLESEKKEFLDRVRAEAAKLGIPLDQIAPPSFSPRRGKSQSPVKYQGPNQHDTWTGRGRMPNWLAAIEAEGRRRDEFLVDKPAE